MMILGTGRWIIFPRKIRCAGFTFIELLIVCAVIAIFVATGFPLLRQAATDMARRSCGKRVVALCRFLSATAAADTSVVVLSIEKDTGSVRAREGQGNTTISRFTVPAILSIECDQEQVIFNPDGTCANFTITINGKGHSARIVPAGYGRFAYNET
jgi:prepilin-type N-terminal cleavage/methylation domain-containing protein